MYCKFCGTEVSENAAFCSRCGKKIDSDHNIKKETEGAQRRSSFRRAWVFPLLLVLFTIFSNITGETIPWVFSGLGLIAVLILWKLGYIKPKCLSLDVLCIPVAVFLLEAVRNLGFWVVQKFAEPFLGQAGAVTASFGAAYFPEIESIWGANSLWLWGMLVLFLMLWSDTIRIKKAFTLVLIGILVVWSLVLTFVMPGRMLAMQQGMPAEVIEFIDVAHKSYFIWMFLRRIVFYGFIYLAGRKRLGTVRMLIFPVAIIIGSILLLPVEFAVLNLGMASVSALSFGYLLGLLVLLTAFIKTKKSRAGREC